MATPKTQPTPQPTVLPSRDRRGVIPAAQMTPLPRGRAGQQVKPPPKGIGGTAIAALIAANVRLRPIIKDTIGEPLPECASALTALCVAQSRPMVQQAKAAEAFEVSVQREASSADRLSAKLAARELELSPLAGSPSDIARALQSTKQRIYGGMLDDAIAQYEQSNAAAAAQLADDVVAKLQAAREAIARAELRASLDPVAVDQTLAAQVLRAVESEPTLRRPLKARELMEKAMQLGDGPLLLACESLLPGLQDIVEHGRIGLTRENATWKTGQPTDAIANATWCLHTLRGFRDDRVAKTAVGKAREILSALEWLVAKSIGTDPIDPFCVKRLNAGSFALNNSIVSGMLNPFTGKTGARWLVRYCNRDAAMPGLRWPELLAPQPFKDLQQNPEVTRKPIEPGHPLPVAPVKSPMRDLKGDPKAGR